MKNHVVCDLLPLISHLVWTHQHLKNSKSLMRMKMMSIIRYLLQSYKVSTQPNTCQRTIGVGWRSPPPPSKHRRRKYLPGVSFCIPAAEFHRHAESISLKGWLSIIFLWYFNYILPAILSFFLNPFHYHDFCNTSTKAPLWTLSFHVEIDKKFRLISTNQWHLQKLWWWHILLYDDKTQRKATNNEFF